jgi:hypothetical protein
MLYMQGKTINTFLQWYCNSLISYHFTPLLKADWIKIETVQQIERYCYKVMLGLPCSTKNSAIDALIAQSNSVTQRLTKKMVNERPTREAQTEELKDNKEMNPLNKLFRKAINLMVAMNTEDVYHRGNTKIKCEYCKIESVKYDHLKNCPMLKTKINDDRVLQAIESAKAKKFPLKELKQDIYVLGKALDTLADAEDALIEEKLWTKEAKFKKINKKELEERMKQSRKIERAEEAFRIRDAKTREGGQFLIYEYDPSWQVVQEGRRKPRNPKKEKDVDNKPH